MSLETNVYCKHLEDEFIPQIVNRLNEYEMIVETQPDFSFSDENNFWTFKFQLSNPPLDILKGKVLVSGVEIFISDFDLQTAKEQLKPKPGFWDKLLKKQQPEVKFCAPEVEKRLEDCAKVISFVWHAGDCFQFRFGTLTSAILTELTDGVCTYPADDIWYENKNIVDETYKEVLRYEEYMKEKGIEFSEFDRW